MGRKIDISGKTYNLLTAISFSHIKNGHTYWLFKCQCGNLSVKDISRVKESVTKSCGCLRTPHNKSRTREYKIWIGIKTRCNKPNDINYHNYGGRGIKICNEWLHSFKNFINHVGVAPTPKHTIDRIDVNGDYEPGNVRWATIIEQHNNCRTNRRVEFKGQIKTISEWCRELGLDYKLTYRRIASGKSPEQSFHQ